MKILIRRCLALFAASLFPGLSATGVGQQQVDIRFTTKLVDVQLEAPVAVEVGDMNGDGKNDIVVADKHAIYWYAFPNWEKSTVHKDPAVEIISAALRVFDGKANLAVGTRDLQGANPAILNFTPAQSGDNRWDSVVIAKDVAPLRLAWHSDGRDLQLIANSKTLLGKERAKAKLVSYEKPAAMEQAWLERTISNDEREMFDVFVSDLRDMAPGGGVLVAQLNQFRLFRLTNSRGLTVTKALQWKEVPIGKLDPKSTDAIHRLGVGSAGNQSLVAASTSALEPQLIVSTAPIGNLPGREWRSSVVASKSGKISSLFCANFFNRNHGDSQIVVGAEGKHGPSSYGGLSIWSQQSGAHGEWREQSIDAQISCTDAQLAYFYGLPGIHIIACGGQTHDVKVYYNATPQVP